MDAFEKFLADNPGKSAVELAILLGEVDHATRKILLTEPSFAPWVRENNDEIFRYLKEKHS